LPLRSSDLEAAKARAVALEAERKQLIKQSEETKAKAELLQREYDDKEKQLVQERERTTKLETKGQTLADDLKSAQIKLEEQKRVRALRVWLASDCRRRGQRLAEALAKHPTKAASSASTESSADAEELDALLQATVEVRADHSCPSAEPHIAHRSWRRLPPTSKRCVNDAPPAARACNIIAARSRDRSSQGRPCVTLLGIAPAYHVSRTVATARDDLAKARAELLVRDENILKPPASAATSPSKGKKKKSSTSLAATAPVGDPEKVEQQRLCEALASKTAALKEAEKRVETLQAELTGIQVRRPVRKSVLSQYDLQTECTRLQELAKKADSTAAATEKDLKRQIAAAQNEVRRSCLLYLDVAERGTDR
jgi:hypothetical protein